MHPCSHDILNYTEKTKICPACTVLYVRKAVENKNDPLTLCTQGNYFKYNTYRKYLDPILGFLIIDKTY